MNARKPDCRPMWADLGLDLEKYDALLAAVTDCALHGADRREEVPAPQGAGEVER